MKSTIYKYYLLFIILSTHVFIVKSQSRGIAEMGQAIANKNFVKADAILQPITNNYFAQGKADSLVIYIYHVGRISQGLSGVEESIKKMELFAEKIKKLSSNPATLRQVYIETGEYYGSIGLNEKGYHANQQALKYTLLMPGKTGNDMALVENNLSTYAQRMADLKLAQHYARLAIQHVLSDKKPDYVTLYISYNAMGATMWYSSKTDSALYYFQNALTTLKKTEQNPVNKFYRPAILLNNLSGLYQLQGNTTGSIEALKTTITNLNDFIADKAPDPKKVNAITLQYEATDNLAGIYKELGDLRKAKDLLEYSYEQKQKNLTESNPAIFISQILLGQIYFALRDYDKALVYLNKGLNRIAGSGVNYLFWQADACNTLALLYDFKKNVKQATYFYEKADRLYEESLQGDYDVIYLDFLGNAALFYADHQQYKIALAKAQKGYNYVVKTQGPNTLIAFYQLLNLSEVYFLSGKYREALDYSKKGLNVVNRNISSSHNILDSIRMEVKKPKAILQKVKANYELLGDKSVENLKPLLNELGTALQILERQKTILNDPNDIGILVSDHAKLLEFIQKLNFDLYSKIPDPGYIDRMVSLHESGLYNRIRARLERNDSLQFANVPKSVILREQQLKSDVTDALKGNLPHDKKMDRYLMAVEKLDEFRESLKKSQPEYYDLKYASIFKSVEEIQAAIPAKTTLIRYFFIGKNLHALVADRGQKAVIPLVADSLEKNITEFQKYGMDVNKISQILYSLCQQLWMPLQKNIRYNKVVIIPDGILFNFNFEVLTPTRIKSFKELATKSLLADHTISYHYSLFVLQKQNASHLPDRGFVAFAPGFFDKLKDNYRAVIKDTSERDKNYLSLLPQPFSISLVEKARGLFDGQAFVHEQSTKNSFMEKAGNHQIIHIGTHAESDNDHPEFSRLIFAKNTSSKDEDNSLYVNEIYNCNLNSNLTVLTACESGKPGYQDGEGMISLANAFNYAGSESILTGLWKIDEQASSILMDHFYHNLLDGLPKDEALRQAKLRYLKNADGRMLAPQYWAGLIVMGDISPILIPPNRNYSKWIIGGILLVLVAGGLFLYRKDKRKLRA